MSRRHRIAVQLSAYGDVGSMLSAMKNIALMELHKLSGQIQRQIAVMATVERVAADFLAFHDLPLKTGRKVFVALGSERGFCGEFNQELVPGIIAARKRDERILLIGSLLAEHFDENGHDTLPGPALAEEIPTVLEGVTRWLEQEQATTMDAPMRVTVLFHQDDGPVERPVAPLPMSPGTLPAGAYPPCLTLPPLVFLGKLMEHAMLLALEEVFALSLVAENQRRLEHMDNALRRLDDITATLSRDLNRARQEDIIQEIETILIGTVEAGT